jgi:hypothetical protein
MEQVPGSNGLIRFDKHGKVYIKHLYVSKLLPQDGEMYIGSSTSEKISFFGTSPSTRSEMTAQLTAISHTAPGADDFAVQDFVDSVGGFVWKSQNEANTVLKVISNLQTRLSQLETYLKLHGLLG